MERDANWVSVVFSELPKIKEKWVDAGISFLMWRWIGLFLSGKTSNVIQIKVSQFDVEVGGSTRS